MEQLRKQRQPGGASTSLVVGLWLGIGLWPGLGLGAGCATWRGQATADSTTTAGGPDSDRTVAELRAKNAGYIRRIEELENRVFVLEDQLDSRTHGHTRGDGQKSRPGPAVRRLTAESSAAEPGQGQGTPAGEGAAPKASGVDQGASAGATDPGGAPPSLVDDQPVEYVGEARGSGAVGAKGMARSHGKAARRPQLRLWATAPRPASAQASPATGAAGGTASAVVGANGVGGDPTRLYRESLAALRAGRSQEAVAGFRRFVATYPAHDHASDCQYWIAENDYDRRQFALAEQGFRIVIAHYPQGKKVPDAMLKLALSLSYLGDHAGARAMLQRLTRAFPKHQAARLASVELARPAGEPPAGNLAPTSPAGATSRPSPIPSAGPAGRAPGTGTGTGTGTGIGTATGTATGTGTRAPIAARLGTP